MKFAIIATEQDIASKNIGKKIIELCSFEKIDDKNYRKNNTLLFWHDKDLIHANDLDMDTDLYIFVFRHKSEKGNPSLTVHAPGNLTTEVRSSGNPCELGIAHPKYMKTALKFLKRHAPEGYSVSYEVTHHGPTNLSKPIMFIEIGSTEKEWNDPEAIEAVAKTIIELINNPVEECVGCVGLGGNHYADRFTRRALEEDYGFGHIIPDYAFEKITKEVVLQAIQKTIDAKCAMLDKRAQGKEQDRNKILQVFEEKGVEVIKLK